MDQALSSGTNFVPALLLARVLGPANYGTFSLAFLAWFGTLAIVRSAVMEPYTLAAAHIEGAAWRDVTKRASGAVVLAGVICGCVFAIVAAVVGISSDLGQALLVIAVLAPGLALQEFWRIASFAASRARTATANDLCWAIGQIVAFSFLLSRGNVTVAESLFAWGAGAVFAAGFGALQLSVMPRVDLSAVRWAREWSALGAWFTAESATFSLGLFGVAIIVAAQTGSAGLGLFRAVQNLFGPIQLVTTGAGSAFMPYLVRVIKKTRATGFGESWRFSLAMAGSVTVYGLVLLVAADALLTRAFGAAYAAAADLVLPMLIAFALYAAGSGAQQLLQVRAMGGRLLVAQLIATIAKVSAVAVLVSVGGLLGAAWGLVVGSGVGAVTSWAQVALMSAREPKRRDIGKSRRALALHVLDPDWGVEILQEFQHRGEQ